MVSYSVKISLPPLAEQPLHKVRKKAPLWIKGRLDINLKLGSVANAITIPPCKYDCKVENKKISRFRSKRSEACYLIR